MIGADRVTVRYGPVRALDAVDLEAVPGQTVGLVGPNGSGKTTLLRALYRSLDPDVGWVSLDGEDIQRMGPRQVARRVAVVAQEEPAHLPITVREMVMLGRSPHLSAWQGYGARDHQLTTAALRRVGAEGLAGRSFATLSGGEKQRVLIARALAQEVCHLLLDEPTNHLDVHYQHQVLGLVRSLPVTTVVVLHDLNLAARYCDHLVLLDGGRVVANGAPHDVLTPGVLEPVYRIGVQRLFAGSHFHLVFVPSDDPREAPSLPCRRDDQAHPTDEGDVESRDGRGGSPGVARNRRTNPSGVITSFSDCERREARPC